MTKQRRSKTGICAGGCGELGSLTKVAWKTRPRRDKFSTEVRSIKADLVDISEQMKRAEARGDEATEEMLLDDYEEVLLELSEAEEELTFYLQKLARQGKDTSEPKRWTERMLCGKPECFRKAKEALVTPSCEHCGQEMEKQEGHKPPRFCSSACKQKAFRARKILPQTMGNKEELPAPVTTARTKHEDREYLRTLRSAQKEKHD